MDLVDMPGVEQLLPRARAMLRRGIGPGLPVNGRFDTVPGDEAEFIPLPDR
jgi:hypothetical protein